MKGWRTILSFGLSGLLYLLAWDQITSVVSPQIVAIITTIVGIGLRLITSTPVATKV